MLTAVINDQSLLVQGIVSHFRRSASTMTVQVLEAGQVTMIEKLLKLKPDVIIIESHDLSGSAFPLNRLFAELPRLIVIEVNNDTSNIQVIRSNQFIASGVADLLNILENPAGSLPAVFSLI